MVFYNGINLCALDLHSIIILLRYNCYVSGIKVMFLLESFQLFNLILSIFAFQHCAILFHVYIINSISINILLLS